MNKSAMRWLPAAIVPVVVVAGAFAVPAFADTSPSLPEKSAQQVLELIADSSDATYSGTLEQSSDFGLPDISALTGGSDSGDSGASSALELLTGTHTARVFVGGDTKTRLQVMDTLAERDVVRNGDDVWFYDSDANEAVHTNLAALKNSDGDDELWPDMESGEVPPTPAEIADHLLDSLDSSTDVAVSDTARVAGRTAYTLTLTPTSDTTLVDSIALSVDSETGLPLAVTVAAVDQDAAAFSVAFSDISFATPDASLFDFTPPATATVTEKNLDPADHPESPASPDLADAPEPTVIGEGWDSIVVLPAGADGALGDAAATNGDDTGAASSDPTAVLEQLTTEVPEGRAFETSLVTVLFATDGRILAGAVPLEQLQAAATAAQ
jgi:outer membrane lipoprotein-sorting protein